MSKSKQLIIIGLIIIIYLFLSMPRGENEMTPEEIREAIRECDNWGGRVIYDKNGEYYDCDLNGRMGDDI